MSEKLYNVSMYLNNALCQSPPNISKTQKAIDYIKHFSILSRGVQSEENGVHHITVVLTNNNLSETKQWKIRLQQKLSFLKVMILSSKKGSELKTLDQLWGKMMRSKNASALPDLIVMCTHEARTSNLIEMIQVLKNKRYDFSNIGINSISMTIMFDEADKNMKLIKSCLELLDPILSFSNVNEKKDNVLRDIHFITATPLKSFWNLLKKCGIDKLKNINKVLQSLDENSCLNINYSELMKNYRWLKEHNRSTYVDNYDEDPVAYADKILKSGKLSVSKPKIIFAPAALYISTHHAMKELFQSQEEPFAVFMDNSEMKGFYDINGTFETLDDFNKKNQINGELYKSLVKWRELNPQTNLAITGYLNIIRGITFNTKGFNFTDVIVSAYHGKDLASLLQLFGRANGGKEFVDIMTLHCPTKIWNITDEYINLMSEIHNKNKEDFVEKDFRPMSKREKQEEAETIPFVFSLSQEEYNQSIRRNGKRFDKDFLFAAIAKKNNELAEDIKTRKCFECTEPEAEKNYEKKIVGSLEAAKNQKKYCLGLHKEDKKTNGYQIFLDKKGFNIIVCLFNGEKLSDIDNSDEE